MSEASKPLNFYLAGDFQLPMASNANSSAMGTKELLVKTTDFNFQTNVFDWLMYMESECQSTEYPRLNYYVTVGTSS